MDYTSLNPELTADLCFCKIVQKIIGTLPHSFHCQGLYYATIVPISSQEGLMHSDLFCYLYL